MTSFGWNSDPVRLLIKYLLPLLVHARRGQSSAITFLLTLDFHIDSF